MIFYMQINIKVSYKLISTSFVQGDTIMIKHSHLYNISKKKLGMKFIFFAGR